MSSLLALAGAGPERQRVSAGNPGLLPSVRRATDERKAYRAHSNQLLREDRANVERTVQSDGGVDVTNSLARMGRPLSSAQVIERLKKCNPNLHFEVAKADARYMGVYVVEHRPDPLTGFWSTRLRHICGMERGFMPEFSVVHTRAKEVPDPDVHGHWIKVQEYADETRGWRKVLALLLRERLITQSQIDCYFGTPSLDSANWQALTT